MENHMEEIIKQQISAAIDALSKARTRLAHEEGISHLATAESFIHDIQFNMSLLSRPSASVA